jgi:hypothetical protein
LLGDRQPLDAPKFDPHPSPLPAGEREAEDDALPAVGKVWEADSGPSLSELLKQQESQAEPAAARSNVERVDVHDLPQVWQRVLDALGTTGHMLESTRLVGIANGEAVVQCPEGHDSAVRFLERNGKKDTIRDVLSGLLSQNVGLKFEFEQSATTAVAVPDAPPRTVSRSPVRREVQAQPAPPLPEPAIRITEELRRQLAGDELIKAVIDTLGGEIVKVE